MAMMSHVQLIFFLIASFFFLSALCQSETQVGFNYCDKNGNDYIDVHKVVVYKGLQFYDRISIYVCGTKKTLGDETTFVVAITNICNPKPLCEMTTGIPCNTKKELEAGAQFWLSFDVVDYDVSEQGPYSVLVANFNHSWSPAKVFMCIEFNYPSISAHKLVSA